MIYLLAFTNPEDHGFVLVDGELQFFEVSWSFDVEYTTFTEDIFPVSYDNYSEHLQFLIANKMYLVKFNTPLEFEEYVRLRAKS